MVGRLMPQLLCHSRQVDRIAFQEVGDGLGPEHVIVDALRDLFEPIAGPSAEAPPHRQPVERGFDVCLGVLAAGELPGHDGSPAVGDLDPSFALELLEGSADRAGAGSQFGTQLPDGRKGRAERIGASEYPFLENLSDVLRR